MPVRDLTGILTAPKPQTAAPIKLGGGQTAPQATPAAPPSAPLPFMAESVNKNGNVFYGKGVAGYAKKIFAKVLDPKFFYTPKTKEEKANYETSATQVEKNLEQNLKWSQWAGNIVALSDIAEIVTAGNLGRQENVAGETAKQVVGIATRTLGQSVMAGLDFLSLGAKAVKKTIAVQQGLEDISSTLLPDIPEFDESTHSGRIANALLNITPMASAWNWARVITSGKSFEEVKSNVDRSLAGSEMIYTATWDVQKKNEFIRRYTAGDDGEELALELQNPWVELVGELILDPLNLIGAKIPFTKIHLPGFGKILGLNVGGARIANTADEFFKVADKGLETAFKAGEKAADNIGAIKSVQNMVKTVIDSTVRQASNYNFFAYAADAKATLMNKTVGTTVGMMFAAGKSGDEAIESMKYLRNLQSTDPAIVSKSVAYFANSTLGALPYSKAGVQTAKFLDDMFKKFDDIDGLMKKHAGDMGGLADEVGTRIKNVVDEAYPSINDMIKARDELKVIKKSLDAGRKLDVNLTRMTALAKKLEGVDGYVRLANSVNNRIGRVYAPFNKFFAAVYMGYSPAYAFRNIWSNSVPAMADVGLWTSIKGGVKSVVAAVGGKNVTEMLVESNVAKIKDILGFVPEGALRGVGHAGIEGGAPFLQAAQRSETVMSSQIVLDVVRQEIEHGMRNGALPNTNDLIKLGFSETNASRFVNILMRSDVMGDSKKALSIFRGEISTKSADVFRSLELDRTFKSFLSRINMLDEFDDIRLNAIDEKDFVARTEALMEKARGIASKSGDEMALVGEETLGNGAVVSLQDGAKDVLDGDQINQFTAIVEGWQQVRNKADAAFEKVFNELTRGLPKDVAQGYVDNKNVMKQSLNTASNAMTRFMTDMVYPLSKNKNITVAESLAKAHLSMKMPDGTVKIFDMAKEVTGIDPALLSRGEFTSLLWKWGKQTQSDFWRAWNQDYVEKGYGLIEKIAKETAQNLDEVSASVYQKGGENLLKDAMKSYDNVVEWQNKIDATSFKKAAKDLPKGTTVGGLDATKIEGWTGGNKHLFNAVNKDRVAQGLKPYGTVNDVPFEEAQKAIQKRLVPPLPEGAQPTFARALHENIEGFEAGMKSIVSDTLARWGEKIPLDSLDDTAEAALGNYVKDFDTRMFSVRGKAAVIANETRDFILHDYNKTYADLAFAYLSPYHYWSNRTYAKWLERAIDNPKTIAAYAKWRDANYKANAGMPEFYRYNVKLFGNSDHPLFFNLEATLNPLNGLTGLDFEDPGRRVDWASSMVDDLGKNGVALFTPLNWVMALRLYAKGEEEAARKWMGRAIPQTSPIKAGLTLVQQALGLKAINAGPLIQNNELDPFVNLLDGGLDPYERNRVARALAAMVQDGTISKEDSIDAGNAQSGEIWDEAVKRGVLERAPGQLMSFLGGVGFKSRTEQDALTDKFQDEFYKLIASRDFMSPEDYRNSWDSLKETYPFADTLIISRKGGVERDTAFSYNVLDRMPPGSSFEMLDLVKIRPELVDAFYANKGDMSGWKPQEKQNFMQGMLYLAAMLKMPEIATKQEWNLSKDGYADIVENIKDVYGTDIIDKMSEYYAIKEQNTDKGYDYLTMNPEVQAAIQLKREGILDNPDVYKYYGSIDTVESFYLGNQRAELTRKFGNDIFDKWTQYYSYQQEDALNKQNGVRSNLAKTYYKQHPELAAYSKEKNVMADVTNHAIVSVASILPDQPEIEYREGVEGPQPEGKPTWRDISQMIPDPSLQQIVRNYWEKGIAVPYNASNQLDYLAEQNGLYSGDDLLRLAGEALMQPPVQPSGWWGNIIP